MEYKRALSPTEHPLGQGIKRPRMSETSFATVKQCLHCGSIFHNWGQCSSRCGCCYGTHPGKRCPRLSLEWYSPGGFRLVQPPDPTPTQHNLLAEPACATKMPDAGFMPFSTNTMPSISALRSAIHKNENILAMQMNQQRAEMIATTPMALEPTISSTLSGEDGGPKWTGSNVMPLGPKKSIGTSWPAAAAISKKPLMPAPTPKLKPDRDYDKEKRVWKELEEMIKTAVEDTKARGKPFNGQNDRSRVTAHVKSALGILRPIILGQGKPPEALIKTETAT